MVFGCNAVTSHFNAPFSACVCVCVASVHAHVNVQYVCVCVGVYKGLTAQVY